MSKPSLGVWGTNGAMAALQETHDKMELQLERDQENVDDMRARANNVEINMKIRKQQMHDIREAAEKLGFFIEAANEP
jgi:hypothetical protein